MPTISAIVPCRNEIRHIRECVRSILALDADGFDLEVIVVDGESTDGTTEVLRKLAASDPRLRVLSNPERTVPPAMNLGIAAAKGEYIARFDAHSTYDPSYLTRCLRVQAETGAWNVGGIWRIESRGSTRLGRAIAMSLTHWLGSGRARYKIGLSERTDVDTVPFGFFPRWVFDRVGDFNVDLRRNQDLELNYRIRRAGGRIVLDPTIRSTYYVRSTLTEHARHNYADGFWVVYGMKYAAPAMSFRHAAPGILVLVLVALGGFAVLTGNVLPLLIALASYLALLFAGALEVAVRRGEAVLVPELVLAFLIRHLSFGTGSIAGALRLVLNL